MTYLITIDYEDAAESTWIHVPNSSSVKTLLSSIRSAINNIGIERPWKEISGEALEDSPLTSFRVREP